MAAQLWRHQAITNAIVISLVPWHIPKSDLSASAQAIFLYNEIVNYIYKITVTSPHLPGANERTCEHNADTEVSILKCSNPVYFWSYTEHCACVLAKRFNIQGRVCFIRIFIIVCDWSLLWISDLMITHIAKFMGPTWGPPGSCWPQSGPMLAPWTLLSGNNWVFHVTKFLIACPLRFWCIVSGS